VRELAFVNTGALCAVLCVRCDWTYLAFGTACEEVLGEITACDMHPATSEREYISRCVLWFEARKATWKYISVHCTCEGFHALPACPSDKCSIKLKISMV
jgi:hypothetical protein